MSSKIKKTLAVITLAVIASTSQVWSASASPSQNICGGSRCCCDQIVDTPADPTVAI